METTAQQLCFLFNRVEMEKLYSELTIVFRELDVDFAPNRTKLDIPLLYTMYDRLYEHGVS